MGAHRQSAESCNSSGRGDGGLDLGSGSRNREKYMDTMDIKRIDLKGFGGRITRESGMKVSGLGH